MFTSLQSAGVTTVVNLRITQPRKYPSKGSTMALKPDADITQSKTGVSVAPQKGFVPPRMIIISLSENELLIRIRGVTLPPHCQQKTA